MNPQPFLFHLCYHNYPTLGTKTRFKGCTITAIILPILFHLVVPFLSTTVCTVIKIRYRTGGIEIPLGFLRAQPLNALSDISCMRNGVPVRHEHIFILIYIWEYARGTFCEKSLSRSLQKLYLCEIYIIYCVTIQPTSKYIKTVGASSPAHRI